MFLPHVAAAKHRKERPETDYERSLRRQNEHELAAHPQYGPLDDQEDFQEGRQSTGVLYRPLYGVPYGEYITSREGISSFNYWSGVWLVIGILLFVVLILRVKAIRKWTRVSSGVVSPTHKVGLALKILFLDGAKQLTDVGE